MAATPLLELAPEHSGIKQSLPFLCLLVFRKLEASLGGKWEKWKQEEDLGAKNDVSGRGVRSLSEAKNLAAIPCPSATPT